LYSDQELVAKAAGLRDEQDKWNDLFATKLIELLDKIDAIRSQVKDELNDASLQRLTVKELDHSREAIKALDDEILKLKNELQNEIADVRRLQEWFRRDIGAAERNNAALVEARNYLEGATIALRDAEIRFNNGELSLNRAEQAELQATKHLEEAKLESINAAQNLADAGLEARSAETARKKAETEYFESREVLRRSMSINNRMMLLVVLLGLGLLFAAFITRDKSSLGMVIAGTFMLLTAALWTIYQRQMKGRAE
jgi:hypothetical protein